MWCSAYSSLRARVEKPAAQICDIELSRDVICIFIDEHVERKGKGARRCGSGWLFPFQVSLLYTVQ